MGDLPIVERLRQEAGTGRGEIAYLSDAADLITELVSALEKARPFVGYTNCAALQNKIDDVLIRARSEGE